MSKNSLSVGDPWPNHYRGYRLHTNADGDVWWQVYQGTDRLFLHPTPDELIEQILSVKRLGGRVRITEGGDVLTRREENDQYEDIWVGEVKLQGELVPKDADEYSVPIHPTNLSPGDLWPSIYDGARYSFSEGGERLWWNNPETGKRHPIDSPVSSDIIGNLRSFKPNGGSFRVLPRGDVITLVPTHPAPKQVRDQLRALPRVVKNIIKLRKERGVELLPIYVGRLEHLPLSVDDPVSLTDSLTDDERRELDSWAASLGNTSTTNTDAHRASIAEPSDDPETW